MVRNMPMSNAQHGSATCSKPYPVSPLVRFVAGVCVSGALLLFASSHALAQRTTPEPAETAAKSGSVPQTAAPDSVPVNDLSVAAVVSPLAAKAIPLPQIADSADDLDRQLAEILKQLSSAPDLADADRAMRAQTEEIAVRAQSVDPLLEGNPSATEIGDEELYWRGLSQQSSAQRKQLSTRAANLETQIHFLDEQQMKWQATHDQIQNTPGIETVATRVQQELDAINVTRSQAENQLKLMLTFQSLLSKNSRQISDSVTKLSAAQEAFRGHIFQRDSHPLWSKGAFREGTQPMGAGLRRSADRDFATGGEFLHAKVLLVCLFVILFVAALFLAFRIRDYLGDGSRPGIPAGAHAIFRHPYAVALTFALLAMMGQTFSAPISVGAVLYVLWMIVTITLLPLLIEPGLRPLLYTLAVCNVLSGLRVWVPFSPLAKRGLLTVGVSAAIAAFAWLSRPSRIRQLRMSLSRQRLLTAALQLGLLLLLTALVLNICGYVSLSHVLGLGTLLSAIFMSALYCVVRVLCITITIGLHSPLGSRLTEVRRQQIEFWGHRTLVVASVLLWIRFELYMFMIYGKVKDFASEVLNYPFTLGKVEFTLWIILSVILILVLGYAISKGSTALMRSILLAKLPLHRGLPYAVSKVVYYGMMLVVLYAAVTQAGVELNKFTVITGALGVGVGFGLQNIVNNFASGLILLFERPIRVDDTVEVNGLVGSVKRIGARSSTIQTFQGAEVIVPNSNLLSNHVINWTLSSPWRRVDIQVGVAYGSDLQQVLKLLVSVAEQNSKVMREPAPMAFFLGFGDSALNFELRFWSARQDTWFELKSDVAIGVSTALREAGIEIPFPQRDLHLRTVDSVPQEMDAAADELKRRLEGKSKVIPGVSGR